MSVVRVMHVVVAGDIGGAERLLTQLAARETDRDVSHQAAVMTPNRGLVEYLRAAGVRVHDRGPVRDGAIAYLQRALGPTDVAWLTDLLARERADVVHTHTLGSHVLGTRAARRAALPQLRTEHHVMHYFDPSSSVFTRWAAARTNRFVAVSEYVRSVIAQTAPHLAPRMAVVRNGVDPTYWAPRTRGSGPFRLGVVCRLTAWKRVGLAIEAAALARAELLVVGDGEERSHLERLAAARGAAVTFAGHCRDPRQQIASCDVVVSTADREPLGLSVLEALSMERPVIAFAGGGIPEIVKHEQTGFLVGEPTAGAFAEAIAQARHRRTVLPSMGAAARRFVVEECDVVRMCAKYTETYRALAKAA